MSRESYLAGAPLGKGLQNKGKLKLPLMILLFLKHNILHESLEGELNDVQSGERSGH